MGDVYSVSLHPSEAQLVSAGYDKTVRLYDLTKGVLVRTLHGHELAVSQVLFNAAGNLVVSAAKDATVRFWDLRSAVCLQSFGRPLGEVTSVQLSPSGTQLLSSSRDNAVRLWDVRSARPLRSFTGHQNTCKSFVRARFGPGKASCLPPPFANHPPSPHSYRAPSSRAPFRAQGLVLILTLTLTQGLVLTMSLTLNLHPNPNPGPGGVGLRGRHGAHLGPRERSAHAAAARPRRRGVRCSVERGDEHAGQLLARRHARHLVVRSEQAALRRRGPIHGRVVTCEEGG